jgi:DNA-binding transcriptional LysR family regulator
LDRWTEIELLVEIAEQGTLSRAAEKLGLSIAAASRYLASLEARLNARLVQRTTRALTLTDIGESHYRNCKSLLADFKEAEAAVNATALNPTGVLRVSASVSFSVHHIAPLLRSYAALYPNVRVHVEAANRYHDLIDNNVDVAIRTREFENDSNITIRRLAQTRRILTASPHYLSLHGTPTSVNELAHRPMLIYTHSQHPDELAFQRGRESCSVRVNGLLASNEGQVLRAAALDSMGILVQPKYIVYDDLVAGRLVPVLDDWDLPRLTINVAFQTRRHMSAKVRTFIDFLVDHFTRMEYDRKWTSSGQMATTGMPGDLLSPAAPTGPRHALPSG